MDKYSFDKLGEIINHEDHDSIDLLKLSKVLMASHIYEGGQISKEAVEHLKSEHFEDEKYETMDLNNEL